MHILVIEDDPATALHLRQGLEESGHDVSHCADGVSGEREASERPFDVIIADRMLPGRDGISIVSNLRAGGIRTPVLFLSALGDIDERVRGLRAGGDDYLVKPYALAELLARLEALGRRKGDDSATKLVCGDLELDLLTRTATRAGQVIELLPREFKLVEYLVRHAGQVVTRTMLLENVWNYRFDPQTNVLDVHMSRLRQKLDKGFEQPLLQTVRGAGYMLRRNE